MWRPPNVRGPLMIGHESGGCASRLGVILGFSNFYHPFDSNFTILPVMRFCSRHSVFFCSSCTRYFPAPDANDVGATISPMMHTYKKVDLMSEETALILDGVYTRQPLG